jgi:hypothetical protein
MRRQLRYLPFEQIFAHVHPQARVDMVRSTDMGETWDPATRRTIYDPGDEVIVPDPSFGAYASCVILAGGTPVLIPTYQKDDFELDPEEVEAHITEKTKAILIGYPANPTGAVMEMDKLAEIAEVAKKELGQPVIVVNKPGATGMIGGVAALLLDRPCVTHDADAFVLHELVGTEISEKIPRVSGMYNVKTKAERSRLFHFVRE